MSQPAAVWTVRPNGLVSRPNSDGSFDLTLPLLDQGELQLTLKVKVTADRQVHVQVLGEPDALLNGFTAWSDI